MKYKVLITTSGLGQRLGNITKYTNKSLVRVGKKPAISYIVESYPKDIEFVVTLGYLAEQVKDFLTIAYPKRKFTFVNIDPYQGVGSSLGYSLLSAEKHLQCPFIFHACDTLVFEKIPEPKYNWNAGQKGSQSAQYRSFNVLDGEVSRMNDKGSMNYDYLHIGLVGINSYKIFWKTLNEIYIKDKNDQSLSDCLVIEKMIFNGYSFKPKQYITWHDVGNVEGLANAKQYLNDSAPVLDKVDESVFIFDKFVIKFAYDLEAVDKKVRRAKILGKIVPKILDQKGNFFKYKFIKGEMFSKKINTKNISEFLNWTKRSLWKKQNEVSQQKFKKVCMDFYQKKTLERISKFHNDNSIVDREELINGVSVPKIKTLLEKVDFEWLSKTEQYQFHGDMILDNILKTENGYCLIDWRKDFGGLQKSGDLYYDLSKFNHNLTVNHDIVNKGLFSIKFKNDDVECDILCKQNLIECKKEFIKYLKNNNFDVNKVRILTPIIWLNMSPLHEYPFNYFLYYFGKLNLYRALNEMKKI